MFGSKRKGEIAETRWSRGAFGSASDAMEGFRTTVVAGGAAHKNVTSSDGNHCAAKIGLNMIYTLCLISD